jgi:hypothetical protein
MARKYTPAFRPDVVGARSSGSGLHKQETYHCTMPAFQTQRLQRSRNSPRPRTPPTLTRNSRPRLRATRTSTAPSSASRCRTSSRASPTRPPRPLPAACRVPWPPASWPTRRRRARRHRRRRRPRSACTVPAPTGAGKRLRSAPQLLLPSSRSGAWRPGGNEGVRRVCCTSTLPRPAIPPSPWAQQGASTSHYNRKAR